MQKPALILLMAFPAAAWGSIANDTFTGSNGTLLTAHTSDSGHTWTRHANFAVDSEIQSNVVRDSSPTTGPSVHYLSLTPPSADYEVQGVITTAVASGTGSGIAGRIDTSASTLYFLRILGGATNELQLFKTVAGSSTKIGSYSLTPTNGTSYTLKLSMIGSNIIGYVGGTARIVVTDTSITAAGRAGLRLGGAALGDDTVNDLVVNDLTVAPLATDSFTDTNGVLLSAHTATTGQTWVRHPNFATDSEIQSNVVRDKTGGAVSIHYLSMTMPSPDYSVQAVLHCSVAAGTTSGVAGRVDTSASTLYFLRLIGGAVNELQLWKTVAGSSTSLGTYATTPVAGTDYTLRLTMVGTAIKGYLDGVERISVTDSAITAAGKPGLRLAVTTAGDDTIDSLNVGDLTAATLAIALNDADLLAGLSPWNWYLNGTTYIKTPYTGAYAKWGFSGTVFKVTFDTAGLTTSGLTANQWPKVQYRVDSDTYTTYQLVTGTSEISITGLTNANHTFDMMYISSNSLQDFWSTEQNLVQISSVKVAGDKGIVTRTHPSTRYLLYGDSIIRGKGPLNSDTPSGNALVSWPVLLSDSLAVGYGIIGISGQGWENAGAGSEPKFVSAWSWYFSGASMLVGGLLSPAPDVVIVNHGENDSASDATIRADVTSWMGAARTAAGSSAEIYVTVTFSQKKATAITNGYNDYVAANPSDTKVHLIDLGAISYDTVDGVHPSEAGSITLADAMETALSGPSNNAPTATITGPATGRVVMHGASVTFTGSGSDVEDAILPSQLSWSSDIDGALGSGTSLTKSNLSYGKHTVTLMVTDSGLLTGTATIILYVASVSGATRYVDVNTGSDSNDGNSHATAWKNLEYAGDNATTGDVIAVSGGTYTEADGSGYIKLDTGWMTDGTHGKTLTFVKGDATPIIVSVNTVQGCIAIPSSSPSTLGTYEFQDFTFVNANANDRVALGNDVSSAVALKFTRCTWNCAAGNAITLLGNSKTWSLYLDYCTGTTAASSEVLMASGTVLSVTNCTFTASGDYTAGGFGLIDASYTGSSGVNYTTVNVSNNTFLGPAGAANVHYAVEGTKLCGGVVTINNNTFGTSASRIQNGAIGINSLSDSDDAVRVTYAIEGNTIYGIASTATAGDFIQTGAASDTAADTDSDGKLNRFQSGVIAGNWIDCPSGAGAFNYVGLRTGPENSLMCLVASNRILMRSTADIGIYFHGCSGVTAIGNSISGRSCLCVIGASSCQFINNSTYQSAGTNTTSPIVIRDGNGGSPEPANCLYYGNIAAAAGTAHTALEYESHSGTITPSDLFLHNLWYGGASYLAEFESTDYVNAAALDVRWAASTNAARLNDSSLHMAGWAWPVGDPRYMSPSTGDLRIPAGSAAQGIQAHPLLLSGWNDLGAYQRKAGGTVRRIIEED